MRWHLEIFLCWRSNGVFKFLFVKWDAIQQLLAEGGFGIKPICAFNDVCLQLKWLFFDRDGEVCG